MFKQVTLTVSVAAALLVGVESGAGTLDINIDKTTGDHGFLHMTGSMPQETHKRLRIEINTANQDILQSRNKETTAAIDWKKIIVIARDLFKAYETFESAAKAPLPPIQPVTKWEYAQNLSDEQQEWFRHTPQGTYFMPYSWFLALEKPQDWKRPGFSALADKAITDMASKLRASRKKVSRSTEVAVTQFASPEYLAHFGMLTTPKSKYNPDGLPAGLTRQEGFIDPNNPASGKQTVVGFGCALCHSGKVQHEGKTLYVDGAPGQASLELFGTKFAVALVQTLLPDDLLNLKFSRFDRFATTVYGHPPSDAEWFSLYVQLAEFAVNNAKSTASGQPSTTAGFFRLDALDAIGNQVFGTDMQTPANKAATTAPVSYPMIWTVPWLAWAEYPGVVRNPMIRNVGEALGVMAPINLTTAEPSLLYKSTALVDELYRFETLLMDGTIPKDIKAPPSNDPWEYVKQHKALPGLQPPSWKAAASKIGLPAIDQAKAAAGKQLYTSLCQSCHLPPLNDPAIGEVDAKGELNPAYWESKQADEGVEPKYQRQFLKVKKLNIQEIGTDPQEVLNFALRFPNFGNMTWSAESGIKRNIDTTDAQGTPKVGQTITMADGLKHTTEAAANRWYRDNGITDRDTIVRLEGYRPNVVLLEPTYRARPLDGIWATGPYLHNGSVANLYELFLPVSQRAKSFITGITDLDPIKVGFISYEKDMAKQQQMMRKGYSQFNVNDSKGTAIVGNSNAGHEFTGDGKAIGNGVVGRALTDQERYELIEYLKTL